MFSLRKFKLITVLTKNLIKFLTGKGYSQSTESDILLLDISNNDEYIWTYDFYPSPPTTPAAPNSPASPTSSETSSAQQSDKLLNIPAIIGIVIGSVIGGALLSFGGFFLYRKRNTRNIRQNQNNILQIPGNENYYKEANPIANERFSVPIVVDDKYNHGQEAVPVADERFLPQSVNELKNELKQEIQDLRHMILQNNGQASSNNGK